jgi:hypothetical protein
MSAIFPVDNADPNAAELNAIRSKIAQNEAARQALSNTPYDAGATRERIRHDLDVCEKEVTPRDFGFYATQGALPGFTWRDPLRVCDLIHILGRKNFETFLVAENAALAKSGLSFAEIASRRTVLLEELQALETAEELDCLRLEANRFIVVRRGKANADFILKLWNEQEAA